MPINNIVEKNSKSFLQDVLFQMNSPLCSTNKEADKLFREKVSGNDQEVAKIRQKIEEQEQKNSLEIRDLAQLIVGKRLEEAMGEAIDKLGARTNMSEDMKIQIRSIIRGYKFTELTQETFLMDAVASVEKHLDKLCEQQKEIFSKADGKITGLENKFAPWISKLDAFAEKTDAFSKLEETEQIGKIIDGIFRGVKGADRLDKLCQKIDGFINVNGFYKQITGMDFSSKDMFIPVLSNIEKNVGQKFIRELKPFISKHIETVKKISETVKGIEQQVKLAAENFRKVIKQYEDLAKNIASEITSKLAGEISKKININYTVGGGFGGALNLPSV